SIVLFEQPVHTAHYALSDNITIPEGSYGAGTTKLDFVRKATIGEHSTQDQMTLHTKSGEKYLLKRLPDGKFGENAWLFRNLGMTGNKYLEKVAANGKLQSQQESALKQLEDEDGVILHHSMGSGKTRTFLTAIERAQKKDPSAQVFLTAPASLLHNVDKEIKKHGLKIDKKRLDLYSFHKAVNESENLKKKRYALAVVDEAHGLRNNDTKRVKELREIIEGADKRLLSTGTANYNSISDMSTLVNIAAGGDKLLPEAKREMYAKYVEKYKKPRGILNAILGHKQEEGERLTNKKQLKKILNKYVNYYDAKESPEGRKMFPTQTEEVIEVPMSKEQTKYYRYAEGDIPFLLRMKIRHNMAMDAADKASLNSFSSGVRQASNSYRHLLKDPEKAEYTPKIEKAVSNLKADMAKNPRHKALVYSTYLDAGLNEYSRKLKDEGINHAIYNGSLSKEEKHKLVTDYNNNKMPVLLISSAGSEGLDTKGTRSIQLLEGHFNKSKLKQVIGRGVRYGSHEHLPENEREVKVEHYHSVYSKNMFGKTPYSIDKYMHENAESKDELFDEVKGLMKNGK
ncbi:MAG TPA: DEAD/DEAH box helicase, partial [Bacteroidia bacterium]|nr:DEAD/DEAH box helicase [Bacteroidia bacterium]